jgi:uncharacterized protein YdaU (DUF1376 family)
MKDPAFLFYSKDFYEGTRTMLPKERACYIDLLIYQHQHGPIPDESERMCLYCSGIDKATLKATLKAKFKLTDDGWINERLDRVATDRRAYSEGQSVNGRIGQFWKKVKAKVSAKEMRQLKTLVYDEIGKEKFVEMMDEPKATLEGLLEGLLKHIANANAIEDLTVKGLKGVEGEIETTEPEHPMIAWIRQNAPRVLLMKVPLNNQSAKKLMEDLKINSDASKEKIKDIFKAMHNKPNLLTNYLDANLTARNWWKRELERTGEVAKANVTPIKMNTETYSR